jgi:hypothetical protein
MPKPSLPMRSTNETPFSRDGRKPFHELRRELGVIIDESSAEERYERITAKSHSENHKSHTSMNVYQANVEVKGVILGVARHYLQLYERFIDKAIAYLKKQAYSIPLERIELVKPVLVTSQAGIPKQDPEATPIYRLYPKPPENRNEEKAIEALFSEHTHEVYEDQDFDWSKRIEIYDKSEEDNYIEVKREIKSKRIYLRPNTYQFRQAEAFYSPTFRETATRTRTSLVPFWIF